MVRKKIQSLGFVEIGAEITRGRQDAGRVHGFPSDNEDGKGLAEFCLIFLVFICQAYAVGIVFLIQ